jgi:hypothetical protein
MEHGKEASQSQERSGKVGETQLYGLLARVEEEVLGIHQGENPRGEGRRPRSEQRQSIRSASEEDPRIRRIQTVYP